MGAVGLATRRVVFPMIYTVTITHTEMHLRAEIFLNNRNESKREKGSLHGGTVGSTLASSRCRIPFLPPTNPLIQHKEPPVREGCSISVTLSR